MSIKRLSVTLYNSRRDIYGNCYWFFSAVDTASGKSFSGSTGSCGESNIRMAEYEIRQRWPSAREGRWYVVNVELPIREFNRRVKGLPHVGCNPADILKAIKRGLK